MGEDVEVVLMRGTELAFRQSVMSFHKLVSAFQCLACSANFLPTLFASLGAVDALRGHTLIH